MIKIFEVQQQFNKPENHQSRIIECESFENYLQNVNDSLPSKELIEVHKKHVNHERKTITFSYEYKLSGAWHEFIHFAQVIEDCNDDDAKRTFDAMVDDDNADIINWIFSKFENGNYDKNFEIDVIMREFDYTEDGERVYIQ